MINDQSAKAHKVLSSLGKDDVFMLPNARETLYVKMDLKKILKIEEVETNHGHSFDYSFELTDMDPGTVVVPVEITKFTIDLRRK